MKLFYAAGTCSHAVNIALREAGLEFTLARFDMKKHTLDTGGSLETVNPKGYVPVLEFEDGRRLTEVSAILQWVADQRPASQLAPTPGTFERYQLMEWLNYLASEIHKSFWPFFHEGCEGEKPNQGERLTKRMAYLEQRLGEQPFLMGEHFTVADAYLVTMLNWLKPAGFDISTWPRLAAYRARLRERPTVKGALEAEGLLRR